MSATMVALQAPMLCSSIAIATTRYPNYSIPIPKRSISFPLCNTRYQRHGKNDYNLGKKRHKLICHCNIQKDSGYLSDTKNRKIAQVALWVMEGVYIMWLFILPYAPGDPAWAIKPDTIKTLIDLSHNFFYVLPIANAGGFHLLEGPVIHPVEEALFNFVIGWTLMFAPLLFTDCKKKSFKGSLAVLWVAQMFLTNTLLIPYMAIRLGESDITLPRSGENTGFQSALVSGARIIAAIGSFVGFFSVLWALYGRNDAAFGSLLDRWNYFVGYINSDRPAYAFIWDIILYSIFQPWLIGDNLNNVEKSKVQTVRNLRFVPYIGTVAYLWGLVNKV